MSHGLLPEYGVPVQRSRSPAAVVRRLAFSLVFLAVCAQSPLVRAADGGEHLTRWKPAAACPTAPRISTNNSLYNKFRAAKLPDGTSFWPDNLPSLLGAGADGSERSWDLATMGLTMFTEVRAEHTDNSLAAVGAAILRRAGFPCSDTAALEANAAGMAASTEFSAWQLTDQLLAGRIPPPVRREATGRVTLEAAKRANIQVIQDPVTYSEQHAKLGYPAKLKSALALARCMFSDVESRAGQAKLDWVSSLGPMFVEPSLVATHSAFVSHAAYLGDVHRAFCPNLTDGLCKGPARWVDAPAPGHLDVPKGAPTYFQLAGDLPLAAGDLKSLDQRISNYVQACLSGN